MASVHDLLGNVIALETGATNTLARVSEVYSMRTEGTTAQAIACIGTTCLRPKDLQLHECVGSSCTPLRAAVTCQPGSAWDGSKCVVIGTPCDASYSDASNREFLIDASGNCLATTNCKSGFMWNDVDRQCVKECDNGRVFSYVTSPPQCVAAGDRCGELEGVMQAFDETGQCVSTSKCDTGFVPHPVHAGRCVQPCLSGSVFSVEADRCVSEGDPCPGGVFDRDGICKADGAPCEDTLYPDLNNPTYMSISPKTSADLNGAILQYNGGRCKPTGKCTNPSSVYSWAHNGCKQTGDIVCPPGFRKLEASKCVMTKGVGGEGKGSVTVSEIDPDYRLKATYHFEKEKTYNDGDYTVKGPGLNVNKKDIGNKHTSSGSWVSGSTSYRYDWRNNDGTGQFEWLVEKP